MQLEVQPEATLRVGIADDVKHAQERLRRGDVRSRVVVAQPVTARALLRQPHAPAQSVDSPLHLSRLPPRAVEKDDLWRQPIGDMGGSRHWFTTRMKNPRLPVGEKIG